MAYYSPDIGRKAAEYGSNIFGACKVGQKVSTHTFMASGSLLVAQKSLLKSKKGSSSFKHMQTPPCLVNGVIYEGTFSYLNSFEKRYKGIILKNVVWVTFNFWNPTQGDSELEKPKATRGRSLL